MMKRLPLLLGLLAIFAMPGCLNEPRSGKRGKAEIHVQLEKIGAMRKAGAGNAIMMRNLILILRSPGEITRRDTIPLSGNSQQTVLKTYENLSSLKTWSLEGIARDEGGITIYRDSVKFTVPAEGTAEISLNLRAMYSMLVANFFPIRDSVTSCELWVDNGIVADSTFPAQSLLGDTVKLRRDYVLASPEGRDAVIRMDVYGDWFGEKNVLLYRGEATIKVFSGRDTSYSVTLFRVGPPAPIGQGKITVTIGAVGNSTVNGYMDPSSWSYVGVEGFSSGDARHVSMAFADTVPYVAFSDIGAGGKARVMRWDGDAWSDIGMAGFTPGAAHDLSFALEGPIPYVAFQDPVNGGRATVMRWDGTSWTAVGSPGFSADSAADIKLAVGSGGPYVAFRDASNGGRATVMSWDGVNWVFVGNAGFTPGSATKLSLVVANSTPYVAFQDAANEEKATMMRWSGSAWVPVGTAGISSGAVDHVKAAISDADGAPYLGFRQNNRPTIMRWNGSEWGIVGKSAFSPGYIPAFDFVIFGGKPHVAFQDGTQEAKATMMRWTGANWEIIVKSGISKGIADEVTLGISANGTPYVAFRDFANGGRISVMRFSENELGCCTGYIGGTHVEGGEE